MKTSLSVLLLLLGLAEISKSVSIESQSELKNPADPAKSDSKIEPEQIQKQVAAPKIDPLVQTEQSQEEDMEFAKDISAVLEQNQSQCCKPKKCKPKQCKPKCKPKCEPKCKPKCETDSDDEIKICVIKKDPCSDDDSSHEKSDDDCCPDPKPKIWECKPKNKCCHKCNQKKSIWKNHYQPFGYNQNHIFGLEGPASPCFDPACFKSCDIVCNEGFQRIYASSQANIYNNNVIPGIYGQPPPQNPSAPTPLNPVPYAYNSPFPFLTGKYAATVGNLCILNQANFNSIPSITTTPNTGAPPFGSFTVSAGSFVSLAGAWSPDVYNPQALIPGALLNTTTTIVPDAHEWIELRFKKKTLVSQLVMQGFITKIPAGTVPPYNQEFGHVATFYVFWYDGKNWYTFDAAQNPLLVTQTFQYSQAYTFTGNYDHVNVASISLPDPVYAKVFKVMIKEYVGQRPFLRLGVIAVDDNQGFCK